MFVKYFQLECKRILKLFPRISLVTIIAVVLGGGCLVLTYNAKDKAQNELSVMNIGVVASKEDNHYIDLGMYIMQHTDDLKYVCNFKKVTEQDGQRDLQNEKLGALIIFPDDYVRSVYYGAENPIIIRFGTAQSGLTSLLFGRLSEVIADYMRESKAGVYAMQDMYDSWNCKYKADSDELAERYAIKIFSRKDMLVEETADAERGINILHYYSGAALVLLFMFWGLNCGSVLGKKEKMLRTLLRSRGLSMLKQLLGKFAALVILFLLNYLVVVGIFGILINIISPSIDLELMDNMVFTCIELTPVLLLVCSLILLVYELFHDGIGGMIFIFFATVIMGFLSGYFYPASFFPVWVQHIGRWLPTGVLFEYVTKCIGSYNIGISLIKVIIYAVTFFVVLYCINLRQEFKH